MQRVAALLTQVKGSLADTYAARTGQQRVQLEEWMSDETWMSAETAVQFGFADAISSPQSVSASFNLLAHYRNVPDKLRRRASNDARVARDIAAVRIEQQAARIAALCRP